LIPTPFEVTLKAPTPYFLEMLTHKSTFAVQKANVDKFGNDFVKPGNLVSNGAYYADRIHPERSYHSGQEPEVP
jgi:oligopeptide transport system substrate-binding protein